MASVSLQNLLGTATVTRAISRIKTPMSRLQRFFGMQIGGPAVNPVGGQSATWDIFDRTRQIATGRAPAAGPANIAPQKVGQGATIFPRFHEKMTLQEAKIFRTRPIGGQFGEVDDRGQRYVLRQQEHLAQRFANAREFMVSRMLRGGWYLKPSGNDWIPTDSSSGGGFFVDLQVPSGHRTAQLDVDGGGDLLTATWNTTSNDILSQILGINSKMEELHGYPLRHIWCNSNTWQYALNNSGFQAIGGSANQVFTTFTPSQETSIEGIQDTGFTAVIRAIPWLTWHIYDAGLEVDGTYTKFFPDQWAAFLPDPSPEVFEYLEGSEVVAENVMDAGTERTGFAAWTTRVIDPAGFDMKAVDSGLPVPYIPKAILWGDVVF